MNPEPPQPQDGATTPGPVPVSSDGLLVVVLEPEGNVVSLNPAAERFSGHRTLDVAGAPVWDCLVAPSDRERIRALFTTEGALPHEQEVPWLASDGKPRAIACAHTPVTAPGGAVLYVVCVGIDVAAREAVVHALAEREARLRAILDTAVEGILTIDEHGIVETVNPAVETMFGYPSEEVIGRNISMLMPEPYASAHDDYLANYIRTGVRRIIGIGREVEGRRRDGSVFPLDLAVSEFRVRGERRFTGIVRDVSARRHAEQEARRHFGELAHASRVLALGEMTSGIAHEVNQPLAAIVSYAQACLRMMDRDRADPATIRDALEQIAAQGQRAGDIIRHLRQLVRKEAAERQPVDVNDCVRDVLGLLAHEVSSRDIQVELSLESSLPVTVVDRIQIEQVVLNLIRNALEAMTENETGVRRLTLATVRAGPDTVEVAVGDTGHGGGDGPPERLFEMFFTTKRDGMGVGLAISRSIIESHEGQLWAEGNRDGGLTFRFTLPRGGAVGDE